MENEKRLLWLDFARGFCVVLVYFYGFGDGLSSDPLISHNRFGSLNFGDLVFPFFLFLSGISLNYFLEKRKAYSKQTILLDVIERFGKLFFWALFIMILLRSEIFVDELMINALLFIPAFVVLALLDDIRIYLLNFSIVFIYLLLSYFNSLPDFSFAYLGGIYSVIFYAPIILSGLLFGRICLTKGSLKNFLLFYTLLSVLTLLLILPYKMSLSPSFMSISILVCVLLVFISQRVVSFTPGLLLNFLVYLGRKSLRLWGLFFFLFLAFQISYFLVSGSENINLSPLVSTIVSILLLLFAHCISILFDRLPLPLFPKT